MYAHVHVYAKLQSTGSPHSLSLSLFGSVHTPRAYTCTLYVYTLSRAHTHANLHPLPPYSSAQLLEPFRINHDIQLMSSGGGGIIVGPGGSGFGGTGLETAFGGGTSLPHPGVTTATVHTSELEDPPGLYEKVRMHCVYMYKNVQMSVCVCVCVCVCTL